MAKLERLALLTRNDNRYAVHPLTRRFMTPQLDEVFLEQTRKRQVEYFLGLAQPRTLYHPYREEEVQEIRANLVNIFDALTWCQESKQWKSVIDLVTLVQDYLALAGYWYERVEWGEKAVEAARQINDVKALGFLYADTLGWVALTRGELENAERWVREGLEYARQTGDREVQCMAMRYLSRLARNARDSAGALDWLKQADQIAAELSDGFKAGVAIDWAAYYDLIEGNLQEAEKWTRKSCDGFRKMHDVVRSARKDVDLARLCLRQERFQEARDLLVEPIHLFERLGVRGTEDNLAYAHHCLGEIDAKTGHPNQAYLRLQRASDIYRLIGKESAYKSVSGEIKSLFCREAEDVYEWLWSSTRSHARLESDPHFIDPSNDTRRGVTLIVRPSQESVEKFCQVVERLRRIVPDQYYYDPQDFHVTVLTLADACDAFQLEKPTETQYNGVFLRTLPSFPPFRLVFRGLTVSPNTIMAEGHFFANTINEIRESLRHELGAIGLGTTLDTRYRNVTAHCTLARFIRVPANPSEFFAQIESFRDVDLGLTEIDTVQWVVNDWLMTHDRIRILREYRLEGT